MTWGADWGSTPQERATALACDHLLGERALRMHRAITIDGSVRVVFRWLCQLKLAPYSYDLLDNFARRSPRELTPGAERLEVGQRFMSIFALVGFEQDRQITLRARRTAVTYSVSPEGRSTRLLVRVVFDPPGGGLAASLMGRALTVGDLMMMRKQLLTLKGLAERDASRSVLDCRAA
jgi:hypothetical protein